MPQVEISVGELLDKITILEIKVDRVTDAGGVAHVQEELRVLRRTRDMLQLDNMIEVVAELRSVNERLWDIEDQLRECERNSDFGPVFVELARSVYKTNDRRAELKRLINVASASHIVEIKSYAPY